MNGRNRAKRAREDAGNAATTAETYGKIRGAPAQKLRAGTVSKRRHQGQEGFGLYRCRFAIRKWGGRMMLHAELILQAKPLPVSIVCAQGPALLERSTERSSTQRASSRSQIALSRASPRSAAGLTQNRRKRAGDIGMCDPIGGHLPLRRNLIDHVRQELRQLRRDLIELQTERPS